MKKLQYSLSLCLDLISPESRETIDCHTETEYFDTLEEARAARPLNPPAHRLL